MAKNKYRINYIEDSNVYNTEYNSTDSLQDIQKSTLEKLKKQQQYRPTEKPLWATISKLNKVGGFDELFDYRVKLNNDIKTRSIESKSFNTNPLAFTAWDIGNNPGMIEFTDTTGRTTEIEATQFENIIQDEGGTVIDTEGKEYNITKDTAEAITRFFNSEMENNSKESNKTFSSAEEIQTAFNDIYIDILSETYSPGETLNITEAQSEALDNSTHEEFEKKYGMTVGEAYNSIEDKWLIIRDENGIVRTINAERLENETVLHRPESFEDAEKFLETFEIERERSTNYNVLDNSILSELAEYYDMEENSSEFEDKINSTDLKELLARYLEWNGIYGYTGHINNFIDAIIKKGK